jgi:DNA repair protein RadC
MSLLYKIFAILASKPERDFLDAIHDVIADRDIEYLIVGFFDDQHRLIQIEEICCDLEGAVSVPVRKITHDALNVNARSIMLIHNHPSGDPQPSAADIKQTRDIARILSPLGVHIDDHLIVAGGQHFSFREAGLL